MLNKKELVRIYDKTQSYAKTARIMGVSRQRIHQLLTNYHNTGRESRNTRYRVLLDGKKCSICLFAFAVILHHKDGSNRNDNIDNLQAVCRKCHKILHMKIKPELSKIIPDLKASGYSYKKIAERLGVSIQTIYRHTHSKVPILKD